MFCNIFEIYISITYFGEFLFLCPVLNLRYDGLDELKMSETISSMSSTTSYSHLSGSLAGFDCV